MIPEQTNTTSWYKKQEQVLTALGIGICMSLIFLPILTSILSIVLFVYWSLFAQKDFSLNRRMWFVLLFCSLYLLVIIGSLYSANSDEAIFKLQQKSALALFPLVFGTAVAFTTMAYHRILLAFTWFTLAGCLFCLGFGIMHLIQTGSPNMLYGYEMVILKDMSPFLLGLFCLIAVIYLLTRIYNGDFRQGRERTMYVTVLLLLSLFLFVLGNRNVLFSWSVVVSFFFLKNIAGRILRFLFFLVLMGAFAGAALFNPSFKKQVKDLTDFSETNVIPLDADKSLGRSWGGKALRLAIWQCSMDIIKTNFVTGVGTGDVQDSLQAAYERRKFYFASRYNLYNAHNQFIQETLACGFAGFLIFITCLLAPLITFFRDNRKQLYVLFLVTFLIICLTESILEISKGIIFYSFFNSIFAFVPTSQETTKKQH
ncbi:MAG TPA: O-antigen ligase family protein [Chitinophagaceae bacterium]